MNSAGKTLTTVVSSCATSSSWVESTAALTKYAGQTVTLQFVGQDDKAGVAYWYLDDVSITNE